jgi:hypothetical protein
MVTTITKRLVNSSLSAARALEKEFNVHRNFIGLILYISYVVMLSKKEGSIRQKGQWLESLGVQTFSWSQMFIIPSSAPLPNTDDLAGFHWNKLWVKNQKTKTAINDSHM